MLLGPGQADLTGLQQGDLTGRSGDAQRPDTADPSATARTLPLLEGFLSVLPAVGLFLLVAFAAVNLPLTFDESFNCQRQFESPQTAG